MDGIYPVVVSNNDFSYDGVHNFLKKLNLIEKSDEKNDEKNDIFRLMKKWFCWCIYKMYINNHLYFCTDFVMTYASLTNSLM